MPFARGCRVGVWFGFVRAALLPAVGTCVVLAFGAMPGRCCFLRVTHGMLNCMIIERFVDDVSNVKAVARCDYARIVIVYKYSMN